jgi:hypothetical protein
LRQIVNLLYSSFLNDVVYYPNLNLYVGNILIIAIDFICDIMMKNVLIALVVILLINSTTSVSACHDQRFRFKTKIKGAGFIGWGFSMIPGDEDNFIYGDVEYGANLSRSKFSLRGSSGSIDYSYSPEEEVWWIFGARAHGSLFAKWDDHWMYLRVRSRNTDGALIVREFYNLLITGIDSNQQDLESLFDPKNALLNVYGYYDGSRIYGQMNTFLGYGGLFEEEGASFQVVNLWIETLDVYLSFVWWFHSEGSDFTVIPAGILFILLSSRYIKIRIKLKE